MLFNLQRWTLLTAVLLVLWMSGCTTSSVESTQPDASSIPPEETPDMTASAPSTDPAAGLPRLEGTATVEMTINGSPVVIEVDGENAPVTAGNFVDLVNRGVYDGLAFHRVVREPQPFVVQGGDPQSKDPNFPVQRLGTGSFIDPETQSPRYIPLEIKPEGAEAPLYNETFETAQVTESPALPHTRGSVAMARSQMVDSASSQFYVSLAELPFLDGSYAVFGYVTEGMDVIDQVQQGDVIQSARVVEGLDNLKTGS